jgi:hypothetical protein
MPNSWHKAENDLPCRVAATTNRTFCSSTSFVFHGGRQRTRKGWGTLFSMRFRVGFEWVGGCAEILRWESSGFAKDPAASG